jgi:membrane-associated protease RseP (regulator of RpoE activity)
VLGLELSTDTSLFQIPTDFFRGSILVGGIAKLLIGDRLAASLVSIHPLVLLGWLGLVINALNLLPAGKLDGGRMMQAIYGRRVAGVATILSLLFLGIATLVNPLALYWAIVILVVQRDLERPSSNELVEPSDSRVIVALLGFLVMILTLIPLTPSLAAKWGIGSAAIVFGG